MTFTSRKFKSSLFIFVIFLILINFCLSASCSVQTQEQTIEKAVSNISNLAHKEDSEFERNRKLWQENKISDYKMTLKMSQTGLYSPVSPVEITIKNGEAVSIKNLTDERPISVISYEKFGNNTIETMFEKIQSAENQKADKLDVKYDLKLGYPKEISIDKKFLTLDDESYVKVEKFELIK